MTTRVKCIKQYLCIVLIKNFKEKENNNTNFLLWVIIMTKKQFHITYSVLLAILLIASEAVIYILFGEKQLTDNAQISRLTGIVLIVPIILSFLKDFVLDMPYIINKQYSYAEGYVTEQSHGGADISSERRSIFLYDKVKDDEIEITVFSRYIDKNTYLKVQYLPHTKYGAIVENK